MFQYEYNYLWQIILILKQFFLLLNIFQKWTYQVQQHWTLRLIQHSYLRWRASVEIRNILVNILRDDGNNYHNSNNVEDASTVDSVVQTFCKQRVDDIHKIIVLKTDPDAKLIALSDRLFLQFT